ncbi:Phosphoglucosamine mutase [Candidatus Cyrtobacter comes]|uniref:Phosphoglucosamine mutase n=1 Tax=Candidatus Cyrtobacter comes TaxID=675776 RepID=A0ABU5L9Q1_9RICK|nr:phosphoglucosamine mutase [Candidatus Cyrtobacter comes]MDZ5762564.1 Phosphoglucosamine mutase [Candidatus Cyrtobacter comes]
MFGTDGIRGKVNSYPILPENMLKIGSAIGLHLGLKPTFKRPSAIMAKDTRLSCYLLESALTAGLLSVGVDVTLLGPMPTPALAVLTKSMRADFGIMISASHNLYQDNGIKIFDNSGHKISDSCQSNILDIINCNRITLVEPEDLGRVYRMEDAPGRYIEYVKNTLPKNTTFSGIKVVIDAANGAAYKIAPKVLWELGAEVISIGCAPNGININRDCGSNCIENVGRAVLENGADIGIALDGDADRIAICDENGRGINGDYLICMLALYMKEVELLRNNGIVITKASNSALTDFLSKMGIDVIHSTKIGDKSVMKSLVEHNLNFGGEQSGHIIFRDYSSTGDGLIAALRIILVLLKSGKKLSEIARPFDLYPQSCINVPYRADDILEKESIKSILDKIKKEYPDLSLMIRKSGTERVVRVIIEGRDERTVNYASSSLENVLISAS